MSEEDKKRTLADVEKTFYEAMSKNTVFSAMNRSASALEKLSENTKALTDELKNASDSSEKLTKSLNAITMAAAIIAGVALFLEVIKLCIGSE